MSRLSFPFRVIMILVLTGVAFGCTKKMETPAPAAIQAIASAPDVPVLRGIRVNPLLQLTVTIPTGNPEQQFDKITCSLNQEALSGIESLELYSTGQDSYTTLYLLTTVRPTSTSFDFPMPSKLQPGTYYFWVNALLRPDASIDAKIDFRCKTLVDASGKAVSITSDATVRPKFTGVAIRKAGDDNINTYRIPGIVTTDKGTLLSVYDIRYNNSADLPGNIDVGLSRSTDNGKTWQPMKVIMDMGAPHDNNGIGDPSILFDPVTKKIWVAALWSKGNRSIAGSLPGLSPDTTGQFVLVSSDDDGLTWSAPYTITPQIKNPAWHLFFNGPGNGITMKDGKLVFAAQYWNESKIPYATIIYSDDQGRSWKGKIAGPRSNTTESQVVETTPGTLLLNMRDNRGKFRSIFTTSDLGKSWTEHPTSYNTLPDPVCMGSLIKANVNVNGTMREVLFFSNPNSSSSRNNLTIKASLDMGQTWLPANQLLLDQRSSFGYSSLTKIDDHTIGILYEGTRDLYFVKLPVREIVKLAN